MADVLSYDEVDALLNAAVMESAGEPPDDGCKEQRVKLKPCPFCGGPAGYMHRSIGEDVVYCRKCGARMDMAVSLDVTASRWNGRTPEPGTSVIRWTCYDGTPETLPESGCENYVICSRKGEPVTSDFLVFGRYGPRQCEWRRRGDSPKIGDLWAYLPEPPGGTRVTIMPYSTGSGVVDDCLASLLEMTEDYCYLCREVGRNGDCEKFPEESEHPIYPACENVKRAKGAIARAKEETCQ